MTSEEGTTATLHKDIEDTRSNVVKGMPLKDKLSRVKKKMKQT